MAQSVIDTSEADVLLYFDLDDSTAPALGVLDGPRVNVVHGPPVGRGNAINALCDQFKDYRMYLLVSDDVKFIRLGWDKDIAKAMDSFGDDIGLVHLAGSCSVQLTPDPWVNWPCVSRKWIDAVGWFNYPECKWFCQDTILQALAEGIDRIKRIDDICIHHLNINHGDMAIHLTEDQDKFLWFFARHFGSCLNRLRGAMA